MSADGELDDADDGMHTDDAPTLRLGDGPEASGPTCLIVMEPARLWRFFESCAKLAIIRERMVIQEEQPSSSGLLYLWDWWWQNITIPAYTLGLADELLEVQFPPWSEVAAEARDRADAETRSFLEALEAYGMPEACARWAAAVRQKDEDMRAIIDTLDEVRQNNEGVTRQTGYLIVGAAAVKLLCDVTMTMAGAVAGPGGKVLSFIYDATTTGIDLLGTDSLGSGINNGVQTAIVLKDGAELAGEGALGPATKSFVDGAARLGAEARDALLGGLRGGVPVGDPAALASAVQDVASGAAQAGDALPLGDAGFAVVGLYFAFEDFLSTVTEAMDLPYTSPHDWAAERLAGWLDPGAPADTADEPDPEMDHEP